ncbi:hypothetical protein V2J09_003434 [Rumex salicifolius]
MDFTFPERKASDKSSSNRTPKRQWSLFSTRSHKASHPLASLFCLCLGFFGRGWDLKFRHSSGCTRFQGSGFFFWCLGPDYAVELSV